MVDVNLLGVAYKYFKMVGGLCALCENCERMTVDRIVHCKKHGDVKAMLRCSDFQPRKDTMYSKLTLTIGSQSMVEERGQ